MVQFSQFPGLNQSNGWLNWNRHIRFVHVYVSIASINKTNPWIYLLSVYVVHHPLPSAPLSHPHLPQITPTSTGGRSTGGSTTRSWRWSLDIQSPFYKTGWAATSPRWSAPAATAETGSCPLTTWTSSWPSTMSPRPSTPSPWWYHASCRSASWCWSIPFSSLRAKERSRTRSCSIITNTQFRSGYDRGPEPQSCRYFQPTELDRKILLAGERRSELWDKEFKRNVHIWGC